jgi:Uma2 family endonuclease
VSPNDTAEEVDEKNEEYLRAGVLRVWVVYPATRSVTVIRPGGNETRLTSADMLSGEDVLPGFEVPVADLFDF